MRPEIRMARHIEGLECYRAGRSSCEAAESLGISERNPGVFATAMRRKERRDRSISVVARHRGGEDRRTRSSLSSNNTERPMGDRIFCSPVRNSTKAPPLVRGDRKAPVVLGDVDPRRYWLAVAIVGMPYSRYSGKLPPGPSTGSMDRVLAGCRTGCPGP